VVHLIFSKKKKKRKNPKHMLKFWRTINSVETLVHDASSKWAIFWWAEALLLTVSLVLMFQLGFFLSCARSIASMIDPFLLFGNSVMNRETVLPLSLFCFFKTGGRKKPKKVHLIIRGELFTLTLLSNVLDFPFLVVRDARAFWN
jgi:hypothetical protein